MSSPPPIVISSQAPPKSGFGNVTWVRARFYFCSTSSTRRFFAFPSSV
jgi:hypothetical protein